MLVRGRPCQSCVLFEPVELTSATCTRARRYSLVTHMLACLHCSHDAELVTHLSEQQNERWVHWRVGQRTEKACDASNQRRAMRMAVQPAVRYTAACSARAGHDPLLRTCDASLLSDRLHRQIVVQLLSACTLQHR